jgi:hypothetical protein
VENLRAATAALPAAESVRFLAHRTIQDHHHHSPATTAQPRAPDHHEIAGDQIIQKCVPIDQDPSFLRIDADILRP